MTDMRIISCPKCGEFVANVNSEERTERRLDEALICPRCVHRFTLRDLAGLAEKLQNLQEGSDD
jgi:uncharacterized protein YbaR (Trm112 family)